VPRLSSKNALITGGSRGLGAAIALKFAAEGADVAVNYRSSDAKARELVDAIRGMGRRALAVKADCTNELDVRDMVDAVVDEFGEIRILVNNAGILSHAAISEMDIHLWDEMISSHLRSTFLVSKYCLVRTMLALEPLRGDRIAAKIINMSSGIVRRGGLGAANMVHYVTAKAGVIGFTAALAAEVAPLIAVNAIAPGIHPTDMLGDADEATLEELGRLFLLGLGTVEDVATTALFLASSDSDHFTGETLTPNGGSA